MNKELMHTIDEALEKFELIGGSTGSEAEHKACAMSLLAWVNGDEWGDAMSCAHPLIRQQVIATNDHPDTTAEDRKTLVRLGEHGVIDTWWVPVEVVLAGIGSVREATQLERTVAMLTYVTAWKDDRQRPDLARAHLAGADLAGANLARADLAGANLAGANLAGANLAGANLAGADLARAYLTGANLAGANLYATSAAAARNIPDGYKVTNSGLLVRK